MPGTSGLRSGPPTGTSWRRVSIDVPGVILGEQALDHPVVDGVALGAQVERRRVESVAQEDYARVRRDQRIRRVVPTDMTQYDASRREPRAKKVCAHRASRDDPGRRGLLG